ncbi:polysaccharide deacetylase family protein [Amaricoccus sp.]|uniref:polysaccharide deacetylase family protein n=1 Tax=Amaricoccus sp. TaxID=1872485 RepID=UPI001B7B3C37|nr:polysaccharide deacetylase family protein [Amaricoccus sp.]MBP7001423.1 polysaccharide deacetylase family protein [Amaricoccus sp.]
MTRDAWLSIDFEDIAHDFRREHGIDPDGPVRRDALFAAYEAIETFLQAELAGVRLTFFTTGIVAAKCPEIVAEIAGDGHEIACHYHFHDPCRLDPPEVFDANLARAIDALEAASGQRVLGFRAPRFSLSASDTAHFRALENRLAYDSSLNAASAAEADAMRRALGLERLALFPVAREKASALLPPVKSGGSYLKLFPGAVTLRALDMAAAAGLRPMVYLHPYEFVADRSFQVAMRDMTGMPAARRLYWALRQSQWHSAGNHSVLGKLRRIAAAWRLAGPMRDLLPD